VGIPLLVAGVLTTRRLLRHREAYEVWTVVILVGLLVGIVIIQAEYTANRGGTSWRYMKPQLPAIALGVAWTLTASRRLAVLLVPAWVLGAVLPMAADCAKSLVVPNAKSTAPTFPLATSTALTLGVAAVTVAVMAILLLPRRPRPVASVDAAPDHGLTPGTRVGGHPPSQ